MTRTADPHVLIVGKAADTVSYRNSTTGESWQVVGECDLRSDCMAGSILGRNGHDERWRIFHDVREAAHHLRVENGEHFRSLLVAGDVDTDLDLPVVPWTKGCCIEAGLLSVRRL